MRYILIRLFSERKCVFGKKTGVVCTQLVYTAFIAFIVYFGIPGVCTSSMCTYTTVTNVYYSCWYVYSVIMRLCVPSHIHHAAEIVQVPQEEREHTHYKIVYKDQAATATLAHTLAVVGLSIGNWWVDKKQEEKKRVCHCTAVHTHTPHKHPHHRRLQHAHIPCAFSGCFITCMQHIFR